MTPTPEPQAPLMREIVQHLRAGRWTEAHDQVQRVDSLLGAWLHGIVHLQEGDLEDAENWYERSGRRFRQRGSLAEELAAFEARLPPPPPDLAPRTPTPESSGQ